MRSITLIPLEIFWWYLVGMFIRSRQCTAVKNGCPPCCPFELSCLNELYRGKHVHSITHLPFEIFWWYLVYICQAKTMCSVQEWLLPLATFWAISIEWTVSRKASELNNCHHSKFTCSDTQYYLIKYILGLQFVTAYSLLLGRGICHPFWWLFLKT